MKDLLIAWWASMGYWRWPNICLILVAFYLSLINLGLLVINIDRWTYHGEKLLGKAEVELDTRGDLRRGEIVEARIWSSEAGTYLISSGSQESHSLSIELGADEEKEFRLPISNQRGLPPIVKVSDFQQNSTNWNLGKLYR